MYHYFINRSVLRHASCMRNSGGTPLPFYNVVMLCDYDRDKCFVGAGPVVTSTSLSPIVTDSVLGGLPLNAVWAPDLCTCIGSCKFSVRVLQSKAGANSSVAEPTPPNVATAFSTTLISLVDNSTLVVQVQCIDAFHRSSRWLSSKGTAVVLSRSIDIICGVLRSNGGESATTVRGLVSAFQSSAAPLVCTVLLLPSIATNVTVAVTKMTASPNAASAIDAGAERFRNGTLVSAANELTTINE
jgi:hypothetical protein